MTKRLPSPELLSKMLRCDPAAGRLWWRKRGVETFTAGAYSTERLCATWNGQWAGKEALTASGGNGYKVGTINGLKIYAHRAIWTLVHSEWPNEIDHINGNRSDNRLENLRNVTRLENSRNASIPSNNTSGVIGVSWNRQAQKWHTYINDGAGRVHLGLFCNLDEAVTARRNAEEALGYSQTHGRLPQ